MSKEDVNKEEELEDLEPENADEIKGGAPGLLDSPGRILKAVNGRTGEPE